MQLMCDTTGRTTTTLSVLSPLNELKFHRSRHRSTVVSASFDSMHLSILSSAILLLFMSSATAKSCSPQCSIKLNNPVLLKCPKGDLTVRMCEQLCTCKADRSFQCGTTGLGCSRHDIEKTCGDDNFAGCYCLENCAQTTLDSGLPKPT